MFWKLVLTAAIIFFIVGQTPSVRNPMVRILLPRSWAAGLALLPALRRESPASARPARSPEARPPSADPTLSVARQWLDRRGRRTLLFVLVLVGVAAWLATRTVITREAAIEPAAPTAADRPVQP